MSQPTITILIRTKNEAVYIHQALDLITNQSLKPDEIIVVDSESTDATVEIVRQWQDVKLIQMPAREFTFGRSLNLGFAAATGDIVVAISAHAFPTDCHWLANLVQHFNCVQVAGVYGRQLPHLDAWPPIKMGFLSYYGDELRRQSNPDRLEERTFSNANAAIRRSCWQQYPFHETLPAAEDQEWAWAMLRLGYQIIYEPSAIVYHSHNESLQQVFKRSYRETLAFKLLYQREASIYGAIRSWFGCVMADLTYVLQTKQEHSWLLHSPWYHAAAIAGRLKSSSLAGLLKLPRAKQPISSGQTISLGVESRSATINLE